MSLPALTEWIRFAGAVQVAIVAANLFIPSMLSYRESLKGVPAIIRQVFVVHAVYIVIVLVIFAGACLFFPSDLAGGSPLGTYLSAALAGFWGLRIVLQLAYYDPAIRRKHRALDVLYTAALAGLTGVFGTAALGFGR